MSVPSSVIHILSGVPLNNSYEHSLFFDDKTSQTNFFLSKKAKTFSNFTYLKPGNIIKVAGDVANARRWNYLMFQNDAGKWYYHFINKVVYLNDSAVELHIELDVIQTYMCDWILKPTFVERTHTYSDNFGEHTVPEGLETGPLIQHSVEEINLEDNVILVLMSADKDGNQAYGKMYGGVYSGLATYAIETDDIDTFNNWLSYANEQGFIESIVAMWMYPKKLVTKANTATIDPVTNVAKNMDVKVSDPLYNSNVIDKYPVDNKKTLTYPYTMLYVSNNMGSCATYRRELFEGVNEDGDKWFKLLGALSPDSGVQLVPYSYKGAHGTYNFEEALSLPAFPSCAWNSDTYKVWLAQNQNSQDLAIQQAKIQAVVGAGTAVAGVGTALIGGGALSAGGVVSGLSSMYNAYNQVQSIMAQREDMAIQPDQARGNHSANINLTHGRNGFSVYTLTITAEYAKKIDLYFTRYGYKVNEIMIPQLKNRENFTYIKTVGSMVTGPFGTEDQVRIQSIFDKGITFWVNADNVGWYFVSNKPLSEV